MKNIAAEELASLKNNKVIREFVEKEALEKVREELAARMEFSGTSKAVQMLAIRYENIKDRIDHYVAAGYVGVMMAKYEAA